jgi:hypothetical protein
MLAGPLCSIKKKNYMKHYKVLFTITILSLLGMSACNEGTKTEKTQGNESLQKVSRENFTVAETDKYFSEFASQHPVNTLNHAREMSSKDNQFVIRENQDTYYSNALVNVSEGATIINPEWDVYSSIQVIDENHYTIGVAYPGDTLEITKEDVALGDHVYLNIRTGVRSLDSTGYTEAHSHQDSYIIQANSNKEYKSKGFDRTSLDSLRNVLLGEAVNLRAWKAFGTKEEVEPNDFLLASAAGWAGLPVKHATYVTNIQPTAEALQGKCSKITIPKPPLQFDKGGFFSLTTYGPEGFIVTDLFALNNKQATANSDGSYTFHFNCEGMPNNIQVVENWNLTIRLYMPNSLDEILRYVENLQNNAQITPVQ